MAERKRGGARAWIKRGLAGAGLVLLLLVAVGLIFGWRAFGKRASGARLVAMKASPQWRDGKFVNPQPLQNHMWRAIVAALDASAHVSPASALPVQRVDLTNPPRTGLRATWLGHSSVLIEIDGHRVLTDPMLSQRASPLPWLGPQRWFTSPLDANNMPALDAVVISHDHYDHLDRNSIMALAITTPAAKFIVPLGVGAHLELWGVRPDRIVELDWWQSTRVGRLQIVCTPARHASGRMLIDNDAKLWAGFAIIGEKHRVYYSGDTGLFRAMADIGARLGPFDLTMIEVGQYHQAWPDWHIGPEQAVRAHQMVRGRVMLPVHWGTFALAFHGWTEPIERVWAAARGAGVTLVAPRPGQSFEPARPPTVTRWWPELPWSTGQQDPIVSNDVD